MHSKSQRTQMKLFKVIRMRKVTEEVNEIGSGEGGGRCRTVGGGVRGLLILLRGSHYGSVWM